jgi:protein-S-isoprenylcysteine O-methyltransferase Ste14
VKLSTRSADRLWVSGQIGLIVLVFLVAALGPRWPAAVAMAATGLSLAFLGGLVMLWGAWALGNLLTIFPSPRGDHLERGPFHYVRHPIYGGGLGVALGVAIASSPLALAPALVLVPFMLFKARYEERLLCAEDPSYGRYLERVRKRFFPGLL